MSSQSSISTFTIGLIIAGLVIGAGGGYFMTSSSLQPQISQLEDQTDSMSIEITEYEFTVSILETDKYDLESQS